MILLIEEETLTNRVDQPKAANHASQEEASDDQDDHHHDDLQTQEILKSRYDDFPVLNFRLPQAYPRKGSDIEKTHFSQFLGPRILRGRLQRVFGLT